MKKSHWYHFKGKKNVYFLSYLNSEAFRKLFLINFLSFSGILPILGNIKLKDISGYLYHDRVPMYNFYFKQTLAVFTSNLSPNERKDEFILQFKPFSVSSMTTRLKQFLLLMLFIIFGILCLIKLNVFVRRIWKNQRKKYTYEA